MKNWHIFNKLALSIILILVLTLQNSVAVEASEEGWSKWLTNSEYGWMSCPDGTLAWEWTDPGMASWNLDMDLTKAESGDELAKKTLSAKYQPTDLTVTYAVPKTNPELWKLLNKYNMRLLLVTCLENNPDEEWVDKGPDAVCYCYALDDPIAKHVRVHFYDDFGRLYGLSEELITPEPGDYDKWFDDDDGNNYYAFNFVCDCYGGNYSNDSSLSSSTWARLDQYWGHSYLSTPCKDDSVYASPHSLRIDDEDVLKEMEEYIVEFRKVRGLPEL